MTTRAADTLDGLHDELRLDPHGPAFVRASRGRVRPVLTRGELADRALGVAADLHRRGIGPGDTVALAVRPGPAALAVVLAALRLRVRIALVDPTAGPELVTARLASVSPRLLVADAAAQAAAGWAAPLARRAGLRLPRLDAIAPVATLGRRVPGCAPAVSSTLPTCRSVVPDHRGADADALVVFTSGTTARPRAVVHTTASVGAGLATVRGLVDPSPGSPVLGSTFFVMGPALAAGAPVALPARRPGVLAGQLRALRPQATYLTPPQARALLDTGAAVSGAFFAGSAPVTARLLERLRAAGADRAHGVYAMTEAFPVAAVEAAEKSAFEGPGDLLGTPLGRMRVRSDVSGRLYVSGPGACHRYLGDDPLDEVDTGDLGRVDEAGRVVLHGRAKDMVLRGAENIYPGLYEPALHVPGVALAVLVGVPREDLDEALVLLVEPEPGWSEAAVRVALRAVVAGLGPARPDHVLVAPVPLAGRSRKPDRPAASALAARMIGETP
ncbi:acyl--CoA ligase [Phycicoccus sp. CSK15P-2]|uniref:class I adenylate-forming enzyme family protein n=1 Tax=Phycicoccus sp. CSK15P-2 TaxID=2807627 RepID=UPI00194DEAC4|nr:class I adenylate-forming enzyme family protein [Phycicoccus sp. CSK15P-2]MBM6403008.1 acyl--CoA ligase [Phycicoccus sp. CSK15P-2]